MEGLEAPCPLCGKTFSDDAEYASHLADAHGLVDDDGAEATSVEHALVASGVAADRLLAEAAAEEAAVSKASTSGEASTTVHPSRIYDPSADDSRLKPIVLGVAGVLLLGAVAFAALGGLGGDDPGGGDVATGGSVEGDERTAGTTTTSAGDPATSAVAVAPPQPDAVADTATTAPAAVPTSAPAPGPTPPTTARPTPPPPTAAPPTSPPTAPPTTAPPTAPPTTTPPTTARPFAAPALSGARIESCQRSGPDATWTFSYVLSGGTGWAPAPGATAVGGGRYAERRDGRANRGFPATSIQVVEVATGQARSIGLSPSLAGAPCR